jgi:hypothetical protein
MLKRGWLLMILGLLSALLLLPLQVKANGVAVQLTPRPTLIPLPTETPPPAATPIFVAPAVINGAYIELYIANGQAKWTVVQWQDDLGAWHVVDGWQGMPDEQGHVRWWVSSTEFGLGPFRWVVYDKPSGMPLATSQPFDLPSRARQWANVEVTLQP